MTHTDAACSWSETEGEFDYVVAAKVQYAARQNRKAKRTAQLARAIETEIIPRLMLAMKVPADLDRASIIGTREPTQSDVKAFTSLILAGDHRAITGYCSAQLHAGMTMDTLCLELLAPAARALGVMWEEDTVDFVEVTNALNRLQSVLFEISSSNPYPLASGEPVKRALLAPLPGEQHTFGIGMVMDFFWRAGWDVWGGPLPSNADLLSAVSTHAFDIVGISVSSECWLDTAIAEICEIRRVSRNPDVAILVGGPVFMGHPERVKQVGADGSAEDGRQALNEAELALSKIAHRHAGEFSSKGS